jgi:hypothetical protein
MTAEPVEASSIKPSSFLLTYPEARPPHVKGQPSLARERFSVASGVDTTELSASAKPGAKAEPRPWLAPAIIVTRP